MADGYAHSEPGRDHRYADLCQLGRPDARASSKEIGRLNARPGKLWARRYRAILAAGPVVPSP